ncbi:MAG: PHP domain-containing protein [Eubacteriaceae bacterium]|nr:PHP domain-containing protein [Eubacteriaceae bacterium]
MLKLIYDPHTHTDYSHGLDSLEDMVKAAVDTGMTEIHVTEHGNYHYYARKITREKYLEMRNTIEELKVKYPQIKIVFGIEANIVSLKGDLDFSPEEMKMFDVVNMGFHVMCRMKDIPSYINIHLWYLLAYKLRLKPFRKLSEKYATKAMINALEKYDVNMITHPMSNYRVDLKKVAEVCERRGTILEVNNSRCKLSLEELSSIKDMNIKIAAGSDAHRTVRVGHCEDALEIIEKSGIDISKVVNVEKV